MSVPRSRGARPSTYAEAARARAEAEGRPVDDLSLTPGIPPRITVAPRARW